MVIIHLTQQSKETEMVKQSSKYGFEISGVGDVRLDWYGEVARRIVHVNFRELGELGNETLTTVNVTLSSNDSGDVQYNVYSRDASVFAKIAEILRGVSKDCNAADFVQFLSKFPQCVNTWDFGTVPVDMIGRVQYKLPWHVNSDNAIAPVFAADEDCARKVLARAILDADRMDIMRDWSNYGLQLDVRTVKNDGAITDFATAFTPVTLAQVPDNQWQEYQDRKAKQDAERAERKAREEEEKAAKELAESEVDAA
jgi:hypothetical protein